VLIIRVRDDGHGFDAGTQPQGLGLEYMRRRVGADLDVISTPGRGTSVQVRFRKRQNTANP
jgi:signal transduction histidine kinase